MPAAEPLRVLALKVNHFATVRQNDQHLQEPPGLPGRDSLACRVDDQVTVERSCPDRPTAA